MIQILYGDEGHKARCMALAGATPGANVVSATGPAFDKKILKIDTLTFWGHGDTSKFCGLSAQEFVSKVKEWMKWNPTIQTLEIITCNSRHGTLDSKKLGDGTVEQSWVKSYTDQVKPGLKKLGLTVKALPMGMGSIAANRWSILKFSPTTNTWLYVTANGAKDTGEMWPAIHKVEQDPLLSGLEKLRDRRSGRESSRYASQIHHRFRHDRPAPQCPHCLGIILTTIECQLGLCYTRGDSIRPATALKNKWSTAMTKSAFFVLATVVLSLGLATAARAQLPEKRFITPDGRRPSGLFAPGVMVGKTLYIAGKGDYKPSEEFPAKVKNCLGEIEKTLKQAGLGFEHVVKSFVYLEDHDKYDDLNKYYGEFFPKNPPARTTLGVAQVPGESRLEITCIAYADLAQRKAIGQPPANRPYSPAILAGDTLYISGKGDQLPDGAHPATFEEQVRQCMRNVEASLKEAGLDFRNVVLSHIFYDDPKNVDTVGRVYNKFFEEGTEPACATVPVDWIPGGSHVEITCIATTDLANRKVVHPADFNAVVVKANAGVWAGNTLYLSGLVGGSDGNLDAQMHQLAKNHTAALDAAGLKLEDIVSGHVYLADMKDYDGMNAVYRQYFSKGPGVRTTLMPSTQPGSGAPRVKASFIAAKTQPAK